LSALHVRQGARTQSAVGAGSLRVCRVCPPPLCAHAAPRRRGALPQARGKNPAKGRTPRARGIRHTLGTRDGGPVSRGGTPMLQVTDDVVMPDAPHARAPPRVTDRESPSGALPPSWAAAGRPPLPVASA